MINSYLIIFLSKYNSSYIPSVSLHVNSICFCLKAAGKIDIVYAKLRDQVFSYWYLNIMAYFKIVRINFDFASDGFGPLCS